MSTMLRTRRQPVVAVPVDVGAALAWQRKGWLMRSLTYVFAQERAAYQRGQHRLWRAYGLDRAQQPPVKQPNPMLLSQQLRRR